MKINRETFSSDGQWNKFLRLKAFFEKLIELKNSGHLFLVDTEIEKEPYIDGYEMGFKSRMCRIVYVGSTFSQNPKTGEYDIPWVDITLKELRGRITVLKKVKIRL